MQVNIIFFLRKRMKGLNFLFYLQSCQKVRREYCKHATKKNHVNTEESTYDVVFWKREETVSKYDGKYPSMSAAWRSGSERRFYDDHDRKVDDSPPNLVSLLRPWIRCFTMIISAWWNLASSKVKKSEENSSGKLGNKGNS